MSNLLDKASIILTPTAYSEGVVHTVKPEIELGDELVTNGDFSDGLNGWTNSNSHWQISNNSAYHPLTTNFNPLTQVITNNLGDIAEITFDLTFVQGLVQVYYLDSSNVLQATTYSSSAESIKIVTEPLKENATIHFSRSGGLNTEFYIDNVSVKRIINPDFEFDRGTSSSVQTRVEDDNEVAIVGTDIPRINYENFSYEDVLGEELVLNGDFSDGTNGWTGAGYYASVLSVVDGALKFETGAEVYARTSTSISTEVGKTYRVKATITNINSSLGVQFKVSNNDELDSAYYNSTLNTTTTPLDIEFDFVAEQSTTYVGGSHGSIAGGSATIDNVSVKEVTQQVVEGSGTAHWLLEPLSTNLIPYSEDFSQWNTINGTLTNNYSDIYPDGSTIGYKYEASGAYGIVRIIPTLEVSKTYTFSFYVKNIDATDAFYRIYNNTNASDVIGATSYFSNINKDTWSRIEVTFTTDATGTDYALYMSSGDMQGSVVLWGAQVEQKPYATSYIPTNGGIATRAAESLTGGGDASLINSEEGVLFVEMAGIEGDSNSVIISLNDGSLSNVVSLYYYSDLNRVIAEIFSSSPTRTLISSSNYNRNEFNKVAIRYKDGDLALFVNGIKDVVSADAISISGLSGINFDYGNGQFPFRGKVKQLIVYKEALTDSELSCITS